MDDKRTPMEAEVLEMPQQAASCPEDFYGTSAKPCPRRSHAWAWICVGLSVIALCTFSVVAAFRHVRLENRNGNWSLSMQDTEATAETGDAIRDLDAAGSRDYVPMRGGSGSIRLSTEEGTGESLTPAAVYARVSPAVVSIQAESYYGTESCTGVVLTADGYILSAAQSLGSAASISVSFSDGAAMSAERVGEDRVSGVCLLKVEASGLQTVSFAADGKTSVGQGVYCLCNPYGSRIPNVFCSGMLSVSRSVELSGRDFELLQAAVQPQSPGYGCPILDAQGRVLGITTPIGRRLVSGEDPCFALSAADLEQLVADLADSSMSYSSWLGLQVSEIPEDYYLFCGFPSRLWIDEIEAGSPADGVLKQFDVVTAVDGVDVSSAAEFEAQIAARSEGDWVWLTIYRSGKWYRIHLPVLAR